MASLTFEDICTKLKEGDNFALSRWGDGEWSAVLGYQGANCDGHFYYPDMGLSLASILMEDQTHYMGIQPKAIQDMGKEITQWQLQHGCDIDWCNADVLHDASIAGILPKFIKAMRDRRVVLIGPDYLKPLALNRKWHQIVSPRRKVWKWYNTIYADLLDEISKDIVVLLVMSMPANIMVAQIVREFGETVTALDIGSVLDPYLAIRSRRYHRDIIEREFSE